MPPQLHDHKVRGHGQKGRQMGLTHHCPTCGKVGNDRCFDKGHLGYCEAANCGRIFRAMYGCNMHPYADCYNLEGKAKHDGTTPEEEINKKSLELPELNLENASTGEKLATLREYYKHKKEEVDEAKAEGPTVSKSQQKKDKRLEKFASKAANHR
ncbi:hypothetical protein K490DRAFT_62308 [Saccharata proteae CBS 121410]|uniref:Uncharacterized protein n=1 Tax=Saccharata proteae CBS 121410 TaxID=1314787 RepID=A0A9P4HZY4_9PEZI|nr:hypothetical protein K490DRAFT_62308 [Saccharata proteae CBS 121410]